MSFKSSCMVTRKEQAPEPPLSHSHNYSTVYVGELHVIRTFSSLLHSTARKSSWHL